MIKNLKKLQDEQQWWPVEGNPCWWSFRWCFPYGLWMCHLGTPWFETVGGMCAIHETWVMRISYRTCAESHVDGWRWGGNEKKKRPKANTFGHPTGIHLCNCFFTSDQIYPHLCTWPHLTSIPLSFFGHAPCCMPDNHNDMLAHMARLIGNGVGIPS